MGSHTFPVPCAAWLFLSPQDPPLAPAPIFSSFSLAPWTLFNSSSHCALSCPRAFARAHPSTWNMLLSRSLPGQHLLLLWIAAGTSLSQGCSFLSTPTKFGSLVFLSYSHVSFTLHTLSLSFYLYVWFYFVLFLCLSASQNVSSVRTCTLPALCTLTSPSPAQCLAQNGCSTLSVEGKREEASCGFPRMPETGSPVLESREGGICPEAAVNQGSFPHL